MATLALNVVPTGAVAGSRAAEQALDRVKRSAFGAEAALTGVSRNAAAAGRALGLAAVGASTALGVIAGIGIQAFRAQNKAIAETSTLISGTTEELEALDAASKRFANTYGGSATRQVEAFYQAISAGVGGVTEATAFLETANKLAVAGVTDVATSVNLLTSAVNVYGQSGLTAEKASDVLFETVRAGKTTVDELNASFGRVLPVAFSAGVSFEETAAAVAALTTAGINTAEAVTGVRAILQQILKPSKEAADLAKELGIEFNVAGLQALGFADFMAEVQQKTGGASDKLAILFSGAEALIPALALGGSVNEKYTRTLRDMEEQTGQTQVAFDKVSQSLEQRFSVQVSRAQTAAMALGEVLFSAIVPAMEATSAAVVIVADNIDVVGVALVVLASTQIPTAVAALATYTSGMTLATIATTGLTTALAVLRGGITLLGGPVGLVVGGITALGGALYIAAQRAEDSEDATRDMLVQLGVLEGKKDTYSAAGQTIATGIGAIGAAARDATTGVTTLVTTLEDAAARVSGMQVGKEFIDLKIAPNPNAALGLSLGRGTDAATLEDQLTALENEVADMERETADALERARQLSGLYGDPNSPLAKIRPRSAPSLIDERNLPAESSGGGGGAASTLRDVDELRSAYRSLLGSLDPAIAATQQYEDAVDLLGEALDRNVISQQQYDSALDLVNEKLGQVDQSSNQLAVTFARTASAIVSGSESAADAVRNLANMLANAALQAGFSNLFGTGAAGSALGSLGKLFGFNARGTNSWRGGWTVVGEEGPELVNLPAGSRIHSASQSAQMEAGGVSIAIDARGAQVGVAEQVRIELMRMLPQIQRAAVASVQGARMKGVAV